LNGVRNRDARTGAVAADRRQSRPIAGRAPRTAAGTEEARVLRESRESALLLFCFIATPGQFIARNLIEKRNKRCDFAKKKPRGNRRSTQQLRAVSYDGHQNHRSETRDPAMRRMTRPMEGANRFDSKTRRSARQAPRWTPIKKHRGEAPPSRRSPRRPGGRDSPAPRRWAARNKPREVASYFSTCGVPRQEKLDRIGALCYTCS